MTAALHHWRMRRNDNHKRDQTMRFALIVVLLPAGLLWALPDAARAQDRAAGALDDFMACGRIDDAQDRLDCYDRLHERLTPAPPPAATGAAETEQRQAVTNRVERTPAPSESAQRPEQAAPGSRVMREAGPDDLDLPLETEITRFGMNSAGDFRLKIREGWIFERAGGPPAEEDMTGRTVTLEKNFMGNWRMTLPDQKRPYWIAPMQVN